MTETRDDYESVTHFRSRVLRFGMITSFVQRGVGALVPLASVPIALGHLGAVGYGAWATAVSVTSIFVFADIGIGTGLMTRLGSGVENGVPSEDGRAYVSSAYMLVAALVVASLSVLGVLTLSLDLGKFFGGHTGDNVELIVALTLAAFLLNVVVSLVVRVQYAVGQQAASNLWQAAGSIAMLGGIWWASRVTSGPGWFVAAAAFIPVAMGVFNTLWFFGISRVGRSLAPSPRLWSPALAKMLLALGSRFIVISLLLAASVALDPFIVARTADLAEVPNYAIPSRVLSVMSLISVTVWMPLWPLHARAVQSGDADWMQRITRKITVMSTIAMAAAAAAVVVLSQFLVDHWLGGAIHVDHWLWAGLALWCVAQTFTGPMFMAQNGAEVLGPQTVGYGILLLTLPAKWWLATDLGYEWIPWASDVGYVIFVVPACVVGYRRALAIARSRSRAEGLV